MLYCVSDEAQRIHKDVRLPDERRRFGEDGLAPFLRGLPARRQPRRGGPRPPQHLQHPRQGRPEDLQRARGVASLEAAPAGKADRRRRLPRATGRGVRAGTGSARGHRLRHAEYRGASRHGAAGGEKPSGDRPGNGRRHLPLGRPAASTRRRRFGDGHDHAGMRQLLRLLRRSPGQGAGGNPPGRRHPQGNQGTCGAGSPGGLSCWART